MTIFFFFVFQIWRRRRHAHDERGLPLPGQLQEQLRPAPAGKQTTLFNFPNSSCKKNIFFSVPKQLGCADCDVRQRWRREQPDGFYGGGEPPGSSRVAPDAVQDALTGAHRPGDSCRFVDQRRKKYVTTSLCSLVRRVNIVVYFCFIN